MRGEKRPNEAPNAKNRNGKNSVQLLCVQLVPTKCSLAHHIQHCDIAYCIITVECSRKKYGKFPCQL